MGTFLEFGANFVYDWDNARLRFKLLLACFCKSWFFCSIPCSIILNDAGDGNDAYRSSSGPMGTFERAFSLEFLKKISD